MNVNIFPPFSIFFQWSMVVKCWIRMSEIHILVSWLPWKLPGLLMADDIVMAHQIKSVSMGILLRRDNTNTNYNFKKQPR